MGLEKVAAMRAAAAKAVAKRVGLGARMGAAREGGCTAAVRP